MNPVTFNDPFGKPVTEALGADEWRKLAVAPLFDYTIRLDGLADHLERGKEAFADEDGRYVYPFERLRISFTARGSLEPKGYILDSSHYQVDPKAMLQGGRWVTYDAVVLSEGIIFFRIKNLSREFVILEKVLFQLLLGRDENLSTVSVNNQDELTWHANGRWQAIDKPSPILHRHLISLKRTTKTALQAFAFDAMSPTNHRAEIKPDQPGRSVEWLRARTHYTFITHGHPANRPMREGATVRSDKDAEVSRMAHNRRAHFRTLRAARFTYAKGKRIFVRSAWVGPKEWRDEGSRQIYRILEPVE